MELNIFCDFIIGEIEECENVKSMLGKFVRSSFVVFFGVNDDVLVVLVVIIILEFILIIVIFIVKVFNFIFGLWGII